MINIKDFSIKKELIAIQLVTTFIILTCFSVFHGFNYFHSFRKSVINQSSSMAQLIGANCTSSLNFLNNEDAEEVLTSLEAEENIVNAWINDADGNLFAQYRKTGYTDFSIPKIDNDYYEFKNGYFIFSKSIIQNDVVIGMVSLRLDMSPYRYMLLKEILFI